MSDPVLGDAETGGTAPLPDRRLRSEVHRVVEILYTAVTTEDVGIAMHLQRVSRQAVEVAARLERTAAEQEQIQIAGLLHELGRIGIPEQLLSKPAKLSRREMHLVRQHPRIGARILAEVEGCAEAAVLVRHHRERYDGQRGGEFPGYPQGLRGAQIPLGSRIIAVVDAFDAMISDRPYRRALTRAAAEAILRAESGRQFDPCVVGALVGLQSNLYA